MNSIPELHEVVWIVLEDEDVVHGADLVYLLATLGGNSIEKVLARVLA